MGFVLFFTVGGFTLGCAAMWRTFLWVVLSIIAVFAAMLAYDVIAGHGLGLEAGLAIASFGIAAGAGAVAFFIGLVAGYVGRKYW